MRSILARRVALSVAAVAFGLTEFVAADSREQPEVIRISGQSTIYDLDRSSIATKTDTRLLEVPQSVSIVSRTLIDDQSMRSMADVVRYVPGVQMGQGEGHRDAPTLRGNSSTADFFVDGVRDDVQYYRDLYNADRIEALKGPNAMIFGRGGGGGVINRVTEWADGVARRDLTLQIGEYNQKRAAADLGQALNERLALRLNAMYEDSDSYRRFANVERFGINPTAIYSISENTQVRLGYERFDDQRLVDRGVPSLNGEPIDGAKTTFFGNPDVSHADVEVDLTSMTIEHEFSPALRIRNHTMFGDYDKFYQNVFPGVVTADNVSLSAYNTATQRQNLFNQTDLTWNVETGPVTHTLLSGVEVGWQETDNFRETGYFDPILNTATIDVPLADPVSRAPVYFRQSASDADNSSEATVAAVYFQDQIEINERFLVVVGVRFDRFDLDFDNHRNGLTFNRQDNLTSPRYGLVYKPTNDLALYVSRSLSYLPSSGDQFSSLDVNSEALEPEEFENTEAGFKWDLRPNLSFTAAVYRLDRDNTRAPGPTPGSIVLTGSQRSTGVELGVTGAITDRWEVVAGYTYQEAEITSTTSAAPEGRDVPLVPEHSFSLWNRYRFASRWSAGVGVIRQDEVFAAISNAVTLPDVTRVDAALFFQLSDRLQVQVNAENLLDDDYFATAHNDTNITPGSPRVFRATITTRF